MVTTTLSKRQSKSRHDQSVKHIGVVDLDDDILGEAWIDVTMQRQAPRQKMYSFILFFPFRAEPLGKDFSSLVDKMDRKSILFPEIISATHETQIGHGLLKNRRGTETRREKIGRPLLVAVSLWFLLVRFLDRPRARG